MTDYEIQGSTRRCATTGRELKPGERVFSVLLAEGGKFIRKDYAVESWHGPPHGAFSFWEGRLHNESGPRRPPVDDDLLLECFQRLDGELLPEKLNFRFVVALLLVRRRRMRLEDSRKDGNQQVLVVRCLKTGARHQVVDPGLADDEIESVQDEVFRTLGWE